MNRLATASSLLLITMLNFPDFSYADPGFNPFSYDYGEEARIASTIDVDNPDPDQLREIFAKRRARVLEAMPAGAMILQRRSALVCSWATRSLSEMRLQRLALSRPFPKAVNVRITGSLIAV